MVEAYYFEHHQQNEQLTDTLLENVLISSIIAISKENTEFDHFQSIAALRSIAEGSSSNYVLFFSPEAEELRPLAVNRMVSLAMETNAGMVYGNYFRNQGDSRLPISLTPYQFGSVRDGFDFGPVVLVDTKLLKQFVSQTINDFLFAGWYALRLFISSKSKIVHIPEFLSACESNDIRKSGEKQFDYLNSSKAEIQFEMEQAFTSWIKDIGAFLPSRVDRFIDTDNHFVTASVIIPVKNRIKTIADAVDSALSQQTDFSFNIIVVDNHSTDGTTELLAKYAEDKRVVHLIPPDNMRGIGGCWDFAIHHKKCGKYAVQLDSDDLYFDQNTLAKVVDLFEKEHVAMVVGSYKLVDFSLNEIPPGIIDHKEWSAENGHNNLLRINGMGAPRAFATSFLRSISIPDVSYGEDYAMALRFTRQFAIGRIYDPIYLCRRWDDNSDADLPIELVNKHNQYKDFLRTIEIESRILLNKRSVENG